MGRLADRQQSLATSIVLHLAPGVAAAVVYAVAAPLTGPAIALYLEIVLVVVPFMLGLLYYVGRRNGRFSLDGVVLYRQALPPRAYALLAPLLVVWAILVFFAVGARSGAFLLGNVFAWLPAWFVAQPDLSQVARPTLIGLLLLEIATAGIAAPIVEELYFRGYLLPRIDRFGRWAPVIGTVLFALYHFWSPWQIINRILAVLPLTYVAFWKKNIVVGMLVHCILNTLSTLVAFLPFLIG